MIFGTRGFAVTDYESELKIQKFEENAKSYLIGIMFGTQLFLGSLITNPNSKFRNPKWWFQYS